MSGYPDDWPELDAAGWVTATTSHTVRTLSGVGEGVSSHIKTATEVLWMNYQPPQSTLF